MLSLCLKNKWFHRISWMSFLIVSSLTNNISDTPDRPKWTQSWLPISKPFPDCLLLSNLFFFNVLCWFTYTCVQSLKTAVPYWMSPSVFTGMNKPLPTSDAFFFQNIFDNTFPEPTINITAIVCNAMVSSKVINKEDFPQSSFQMKTHSKKTLKFSILWDPKLHFLLTENLKY